LTAKDGLKSRILRMLKEDEEFRYAVAGLIGLEEILKRLDRREDEVRRIWQEIEKLGEDMIKLREDMMKMFEKHEERFARIEQELVRLREDMMRGFELMD
jgi:t-SNARE complex subunit (syntaxin)